MLHHALLDRKEKPAQGDGVKRLTLTFISVAIQHAIKYTVLMKIDVAPRVVKEMLD